MVKEEIGDQRRLPRQILYMFKFSAPLWLSAPARPYFVDTILVSSRCSCPHEHTWPDRNNALFSGPKSVSSSTLLPKKKSDANRLELCCSASTKQFYYPKANYSAILRNWIPPLREEHSRTSALERRSGDIGIEISDHAGLKNSSGEESWRGE